MLELVERYISTKTGVRNSTRAGYKTVTNFLGKDPLGSRRIDKVKLSDAKIWLIKLKQERFTVQSAIGGGLILAGILVSESPDSKKRLVHGENVRSGFGQREKQASAQNACAARNRELRKPQFTGLLSSRFLPKKRY